MFKDRKQYRQIKRSRMFDKAYYLLTYPDVRKADIDPLMHFIKEGWKEGRNPSSTFNTQDYLKEYPDLLVSGMNPLIHYIQHHQIEYQSIFTKLVKQAKYLWQYLQIKRSGLFDAKYYLETYPDVRSADVDPLMHFIKQGWKEGRNPSSLFDTNYYLKQYDDVSTTKINPLIHYLKFGAFENRDPSPFFNSAWYLQQNPDVRESGINPLVHYIQYGRQEQRKIINPELLEKDLHNKLISVLQEKVIDLLKLQTGGLAFETMKSQDIIPLSKWHLEFSNDQDLNKKFVSSLSQSDNEGYFFTIILLVDEHPIHLVYKAIQSVINQTYSKWKLCVFIVNNSILDAEVLNLSVDKFKNKMKFFNISNDENSFSRIQNIVNYNKSDFILFFNPFDELHTKCLHGLAQIITESNANIIISETDQQEMIVDEELFYRNSNNSSLPIAQLLVIKRELFSHDTHKPIRDVAGYLEQVIKSNNELEINQIENTNYFYRPVPARGIQFFIKVEHKWVTLKGVIPTKLSIDARLLHRQITGTERYLTELLKGLSAVRHEYGLIIEALCYQQPKEIIEGVNFVTDQHLSAIHSSDIFHKTFPASDNETLSEMALAPTVVFSPLDLILFNSPNYFSSEFDFYLFRNRMKIAVAVSNCVIAISEHGKTDLMSYLNLPSDIIHSIYLGLSNQFTIEKHQNTEDELYKMQIPKNYFLFVGTNFPHKNLFTLLKAFNILLKEEPEIFLVIVGASLHQQPQVEVNQLLHSLKNNIITLGHVSDQILRVLYQHAIALTFPSLYEGFGLPVLEAMRHNTPVICSNCTSLPEVCGDAALYFDGYNEQQLANAMLLILSNKELRKELINKGQKNIERFKWEFTISKTIDVYKNAIKDASSKSHIQSSKSILSILKRLSPNRPTILMVTHLRFYPPTAGNEQRVLKLLRYLKKLGYQIVMLAYPFMGEPPLTNDTSNQIHQFVDYYEEMINPGNTSDNKLQSSNTDKSNILSKWNEVESSFCPQFLLDHIKQLINLFSPEIIFAEYIWTSRIFTVVPEGCLRIIDLIDLFSQKNEGLLRFGIKDELAISWEEELEFINRADIAVAIQNIEASKLSEKNPNCQVITAGIDYDFKELSSTKINRNSLLIIGSGNQINNHCINEFLEQAWPLIVAEEPDCALTIVGKVCNAVKKIPANVTLIPYAEDLSPFYSSASMVINPVYAGTGLKIKSVEALAHGKVLISWPEGVAGINAMTPYPYIVIQSWSELSEAVIKTLRDQEQKYTLENLAIQYTKNHLNDRLVYRELADRIDIHSKRTINILCLFLQYGPNDYPQSLEKLHKWYQKQEENADFSVTVWIIDNKITKDYDGIDLETGHRLISGDNAQSEFSGFQKILNKYQETIKTFDIIHFVTSAYDQLYTGYLDHFSTAHLYPILHRPLCLGHIDTYDEPILIDGNKSQSWIRTCFFFLSPQSLYSINQLNHFKSTQGILDISGEYIENEIIDKNYIGNLRRWLGGQIIQGVAWHGTITNHDDLKRKTLAILNEHMLSLQFRKQGIDLIDYYWLSRNIEAVNTSFNFRIPDSMTQVRFRQSKLFSKIN